ncbi:hypothetical protein PUN28_000602 [Cardiocondyla obscurior]|uniref:Uncharacterized protein n=1 Tax=Cardiocondyla obscurior TaxID=286306 RepID=A0AAW2H0F7_9HYME
MVVTSYGSTFVCRNFAQSVGRKFFNIVFADQLAASHGQFARRLYNRSRTHDDFSTSPSRAVQRRGIPTDLLTLFCTTIKATVSVWIFSIEYRKSATEKEGKCYTRITWLANFYFSGTQPRLSSGRLSHACRGAREAVNLRLLEAHTPYSHVNVQYSTR